MAFVSRNRFEAYARSPVGVFFDDVTIFGLVFTSIADSGAADDMQLFDSLFGNGEGVMLLVNNPKRITIATNLFLVSVSQQRFAKDHRFYARLFNRHTFNPV
jgi:hypothetical protein